MTLEYTIIRGEGRQIRTLEELTEKPDDKPVGVAGGVSPAHCLNIAMNHYKGDFHTEVHRYRICEYEDYPELSERCGLVIEFYR